MEEAWKSSIFVTAGEKVGESGEGAGRDKEEKGRTINGNQQEAH